MASWVLSLFLIGAVRVIAQLPPPPSPPVPPILESVSYSAGCGNTSKVALGNLTSGLDFDLFTPKSSPITAGQPACYISLNFNNWPVNWTMAITEEVLRGHLKLPQGTELFRLKTLAYTAVAETLLSDVARDADFDGYIQTEPLAFDTILWSTCRTSEEQDDSWTLTVRSVADLHVSNKTAVAASGAVAIVPFRMTFDDIPLVLENDTLRSYLKWEWRQCNATATPM